MCNERIPHVPTRSATTFRGDALVVPRMHAMPPARLAVPTFVVYELRYGLMRLPPPAAQPRLQTLEKLLNPLRILDFDEACAQLAATLRSQLETHGTPIGSHDLLIAATALRNSAGLVTRNVREFSRVPGLELVNWHDVAVP